MSLSGFSSWDLWQHVLYVLRPSQIKQFVFHVITSFATVVSLNGIFKTIHARFVEENVDNVQIVPSSLSESNQCLNNILRRLRNISTY